MKQIRVFGIGLILFYGCKEEIADFLFDASRITEIRKYEYQYKQGQKQSQTEKTYILMSGKIQVLFSSKTTYNYNDKDLVIKEITYTGDDEKPKLKYLNYDANDSLIYEAEINVEGDTSLIREYEYSSNSKQILEKRLVINFDKDINIELAKDHRTYDTMISSQKEIYENNALKTYIYGRNGKTTSVIDYEYKENKMFKKIHYSFLNNNKQMEEVTYFDYTKNDRMPEYFTLNKNNDTIAYIKLKIKDNKLFHSIELLGNEFGTTEIFYKNGQKVGEVQVDNTMKRYYSYLYNEKGELMEEKFYSEKVKPSNHN